jgi:6-pyruvoyl-tetrahydropterin synthase
MNKESFAIELYKLFKINSSHFVVYEGFREPLHGHNYKISLKIKARKLNACKYVLDFGDAKEIMEKICRKLHNSLLIPKNNPLVKITEFDESIQVDVPDGSKFVFPTKDVRVVDTEQISAECLAKYICLQFWDAIREKDAELLKQIEITKIVCKVFEDKGKVGIYYLE